MIQKENPLTEVEGSLGLWSKRTLSIAGGKKLPGCDSEYIAPFPHRKVFSLPKSYFASLAWLEPHAGYFLFLFSV